MDSIDEQGFRANVGIILTDGSGSVLIAGRRGRGGWQFPQGGIRPEETVEGAMFRELREEVGLRPSDVELSGDGGLAALRLPNATFAASNVHCASVRSSVGFCSNSLGDIERLRFDLTDEPEFDRCRWVDYWRPVKEVIYFKRPVYVRALRELGPLAFPNAVPPPPPSWWPRRWQRACGRLRTASDEP